MDMNHRDKAEARFMAGYNCAQSVLLAFEGDFDIDEDVLARLSSSLGGGVGGLREICGTLSAMALVMGLKYGPTDPNDRAAKQAHYARIKELAAKFEGEFGALRCEALLKNLEGGIPPAPSERTPAYYAERPCAQLVGRAAELIDEYLIAHESTP